LRRATPPALARFPGREGGALVTLCEAICADPVDPRGPADGAGNSACPNERWRGGSRQRLDQFCSWRRRLRLFKSIELLGGGMGVTQAAMEAGYRLDLGFYIRLPHRNGCSPRAYMRGRATRGSTSARADADREDPSIIASTTRIEEHEPGSPSARSMTRSSAAASMR
jgi:AraC-like DNA-binding protein